MNSYGQLGLGPSGGFLNRGQAPGQMGDNLPAVDLGGGTAKAIACGEGHTCALLDDASVRCARPDPLSIVAGILHRLGGDADDIFLSQTGAGDTMIFCCRGWGCLVSTGEHQRQ